MAKKFGTFQGVFTPTTLTILGVIMYLREGWVVGNAGLLGAIAIILLASAITFFTTLSMSSMTSNIRIKAGGAFSIISQSLGLEAGGAIGIPLYLAQAFAVAMYIFGFREGWNFIFPDHPALVVDFITFFAIVAIALISTDVAFKIQYVILAVIAGSLISIGLALTNTPINTDIQLFGKYPGSPENGFSGSNFWIVFAVYFPAVTGIMAGANMSGDLKNPRHSIPKGTILSQVICTIIYIALAVLLALIATPKELAENYNILIEKAFWTPIVLAGLLGATFSSALSSIVGAPRILNALGRKKILFANNQIAAMDERGEPTNALYITAILVALALLLRNLNAIAPLLTMFFLITYAMINVVVLIEQSLGQVSFRPTLRVPLIVPLLGTIGCFFTMFIINSTVSFIAVGLVILAYVLLMRKKFESERGDARSGMFNALSGWATRMVNALPPAKTRAWQPSMVIPAYGINDVVRSYKILASLARPKGAIKILGFADEHNRSRMQKRFEQIRMHFMNNKVSCTAATVEGTDFLSGMNASLQAFQANVYKPNTVFISLTDDESKDELYQNLLNIVHDHGYGLYLYIPYRKVGTGLERNITLWLRSEDIIGLDENKPRHFNLSMLTTYLLRKNWNAKVRMHVLMNEDASENVVQESIDRLKTLARISRKVEFKVSTRDRSSIYTDSIRPDLNITYLLPSNMDIKKLRRKTENSESSFLFTLDSGVENVFA